MTHYLAYGSNLHPLRLTRRVSSALLVGSVTLPGYALTFSKRSVDGSAKCTISRSNDRDSVHAALFVIDPGQMPILDAFEGLGQGYEHEKLHVETNDTKFNAITYVAVVDYIDKSLRPYHWYKDLVLAGVRYHGFPRAYETTIAAIKTIEDPDPARRQDNAALLDELQRTPT